MQSFSNNCASTPRPRPPHKPTLVIQTRDSFLFVSYVIIVHAIAVLMLCATPLLPWEIVAILTALAVLNARHMLSERPPAAHILWQANNQLLINLARSHDLDQNSRLCLQLDPRSTHNSLFILLQFTSEHPTQMPWLIMRDAVSEGDYRKIRARLFLDKRVSLHG